MKSIDNNHEIERLKDYAGDFLTTYYGVNISRNFKCILPNHQDKTPSMSYNKETKKAHCFACGESLDLFDLIGLYFDIEGFTQRLDKARSIYGDYRTKPTQAKLSPRVGKDYACFYARCKKEVNKTDYFYKRGLSQQIIDKYNLGYDAQSDYPYIVPVTNSFYIARCKDSENQRKTLNPKGEAVEALNKQYLFEDAIVFVVEGWADALSIEEVGGKAISLNGAGNARLISSIDGIKAKLVIMGDNDEAGKRLNDSLAKQLEGVSFCIDYLPKEYHDANDMLIKNRLGLQDFVSKERKFNGLAVDIDSLDSDSLFSAEVIDYYTSITDHIEKTKFRVKLSNKAKELKLGTAFEKFIKPYDKMSGKKAGLKLTVAFPLKLNFGEWVLSDNGVYKPGDNGLECACTHPIIISKRLINKETRCEKIELSFYKDKMWERVIVDKVLISDRRNIVSLASRGVNVTSETAKTLINYLFDLQALNCDIIPLEYSVSRLGWTVDDKFSPYYDGIVFDGEMEYGKIYRSIKSEGELSKWLSIAKKAMDKSLVVRLFVTSSLASPILKKMNLPIFFTHLWGETEVGKTVAMMLAMSVWGDPKMLTRTHNSTNVALEKLASFFNNVPLALDELQTIKDKFTSFDKVIYMLGTGTSRSRGKKDGGVDIGENWCLTVLSTGEQPITDEHSNSGAKNRSIEIYVKDKLFSSPMEVVETITSNYGLVGRLFTTELARADSMELSDLYKELSKEFRKYDFTDKQLSSITALAMADCIFSQKFYEMGKSDSIKRAKEFISKSKNLLSQNSEIKLADRVYDDIIGWIASNPTRFKSSDVNFGEVLGEIKVEDYEVFIIGTQLKKYLKDIGYSYKAVLNELANKNYIKKNAIGDNTVAHRIGGVSTSCVRLKLLKERIRIEDLLEVADENIPF